MATMTDPEHKSTRPPIAPATSAHYWKRCADFAQHCREQLGELDRVEVATWVDYVNDADPEAQAPR